MKDAVDEIVIVDTGSTDKTVEIAYEYTNKVFNYKWTNNFSEARNYAQSKALGQWILVMDADEYAYLDNLRDVVNNLKKNDHPYDAYDVKIFSFTGYKGQFTIQHWHTRIYKNDPSIKYYRTIHEQLQKNDEHLSAGLSDLVLYHSGYLAS
ncbi:glycosyltransferase [Terrilactibacillus sp. S3-3]|nr:glycosyltransferase [Terrilactibacillus sp. S3-3]